MKEKAQRHFWGTHPMPAEVAPLPYHRVFNTEEYEQISLGLIPHAMEDKWFIFLEEDRLFFHRSWTGLCVYEVRLERKGGEHVVAEAFVNQHPEQYKESNVEYAAAILNFLVENFLLGKRIPFPLPADLPPENPKGIYQHHISGSGYAEVQFKEKD
jgi:hypothetical protein